MYCNVFLQKLASMQETGPVDIVVGWEPLVSQRVFFADPGETAFQMVRGFSQGCIVSHLVAAVLRERGAEGGDWSLGIDINPCFIIRTLKLTAPEKYGQKVILFLLWCERPGFFCCAFREECVCRVVALAFGFRQPWQYFKKRSWPMDAGWKVAKSA